MGNERGFLCDIWEVLSWQVGPELKLLKGGCKIHENPGLEFKHFNVISSGCLTNGLPQLLQRFWELFYETLCLRTVIVGGRCSRNAERGKL